MKVMMIGLLALVFLGACKTTADASQSTSAQGAIKEDPRSPEGSTEVGEDGSLILHEHEEALLDDSHTFPIKAASWGGKVRNGPGMNHAHVDSLSEGEPVLLLARTVQIMNGYPWFEIEYRGNRRGFKWGGILCETTTPVRGLYQTCSHSPQAPAPKVTAEVRPSADITALDQMEMVYQLLPGRWQSTSDPMALLSFDANRATSDVYNGQSVTAGSWTLEEFQASPTKVTLRRTIDGHVDVYSILFLNAEELTLSYLPRGVTLTYKRMN